MRLKNVAIRQFIIENLPHHNSDIASYTAKMFSMSVQAVNRHLKKLIDEDIIEATGKTKGRKYTFKETRCIYRYEITDGLSEDVIWRRDIKQHLAHLPKNVLGIWEHCFSEIFNNAREHSRGISVSVIIYKSFLKTRILISDNGIGIFNNIRDTFHLQDNREVAIELAKGKMTTDKTNHTGEGIFFSSRMMDRFLILSYGISWIHDFNKADWIFEENSDSEYNGTRVAMELSNQTDRTKSEIFEKYGEQAFDTTIIPVILMTSNGDGIVSRSQARRLLARLETFDKVFLDFKGVESIGQAFADEIFRVFINAHPNAKIFPIHTNKNVESMILRAQNTRL
ncbi:MAG: DUF4325 domain-containing protein [Alphaproteobacteria bacterium]|nr:DUF4325 domain-containing protein [Alphaproteobacteria bacterium]